MATKATPIRKAAPERSANTIELARRDILTLYRGCAQVANVAGSVRFAYAVARTSNLIEPTARAIEKSLQPSEEFMAYAQAHRQIATELGRLEETGQPQVRDGHYVVPPDNRAEFDRRIERMRREHQQAIDAEDARRKALDELLDEREVVTVHRLPFNELPPDLTPGQVAAILPIVIDDEDDMP